MSINQSLSNPDFSVLLLVKNRQEHLVNVLRGIEQSTMQPQETIIVHMNEAAYTVDSPLRVRQIELSSDEALPLARARNMAAANAQTDRLIFLDVDCIPAAHCFETLLHELTPNVLIMAQPLYLQRTVETIDFERLRSDAQPNPARANLALGNSDRYELFWSLGFAIMAADFAAIGGFDEAFTGYGGEDTDFAFSARQAGIKLLYSEATVYHQPHASYDPPLNWLADITYNAQVFYDKWGSWPMEGWLNAFADQGYITRGSDKLTVIKLPTEDDIRRAQR